MDTRLLVDKANQLLPTWTEIHIDEYGDVLAFTGDVQFEDDMWTTCSTGEIVTLADRYEVDTHDIDWRKFSIKGEIKMTNTVTIEQAIELLQQEDVRANLELTFTNTNGEPVHGIDVSIDKFLFTHILFQLQNSNDEIDPTIYVSRANGDLYLVVE